MEFQTCADIDHFASRSALLSIQSTGSQNPHVLAFRANSPAKMTVLHETVRSTASHWP